MIETGADSKKEDFSFEYSFGYWTLLLSADSAKISYGLH